MTTRRWPGATLHGLAQAEEATFAAMAAVVEDGCEQQFQHFISNAPWRHEPVIEQIARDADRLLGGKPDSALIIDESSFARQGDRSVGVPLSDYSTGCAGGTLASLARQWCGHLGKTDNCQVAVFAVLTDWRMERAFGDAKGECGLADDQAVGWRAWHHHVTMMMLAMLFIAEQRVAHQPGLALLAPRDIVEMLKETLPRKPQGKEALVARINQRHARRRSAIESRHRSQHSLPNRARPPP